MSPSFNRKMRRAGPIYGLGHHIQPPRFYRPLTIANVRRNDRDTAAIVQGVMSCNPLAVSSELFHHFESQVKVLVESTIPLEAQLHVQLEAEITINYEHNYYRDLGVSPDSDHDSIQRAYDAKYYLWGPVSGCGKWRFFSRNEYKRRKAQKNWRTIQAARAVLLVPENRVRYATMRAEMGADPETPFEFDMAGPLEDRNEDGARVGIQIGDNESTVGIWCGETGRRGGPRSAMHIPGEFRRRHH